MRRRTLIRALAVGTLAPAGLGLGARSASAAADSYGIDVATTQGGIDLALARNQGQQFAIAKTGGSQLSEGPYVSPYYTAQVDSARAAGLRVGHYWLSGDFQAPTDAANYFVDHLHDYRQGDVLALDDEVLDDSTGLWNDGQVAAWFRQVQARVGTCVPWFYIGAANLRGGSWGQTIATGAKLWVAAYGSNNGTRQGEPELGGAYPDWAVHQYTSVGSIGGIRNVDHNLARGSAFDLVAPGSGGGGGGGGGGGLPKTTTEQDGIPGPVFWSRAQKWLSLTSGYTGPVDGVPGVNTYAALQRYLKAHFGYAGPVDGVPGVNTYAAWQRLAAQWGYTGPIDGVMGPNSWRGVARFLNQNAWD
ncbi:glycoside hydrolase family 25 protein [Streptomyces sp. NPDC088197]|uniref:glycoside hydrolase family 25 protein n=1 Tax=unclassified Streptomyces TaxID=2593676 RepID=UPI0036EBBA7D